MASKADTEAFLQNLDLPTLSPEQKQLLNRPITAIEMQEVIRSLTTGKAPGLDGFTAEFY